MHHGRSLAYDDLGPSLPEDGEAPDPRVSNTDALAAIAEAALSSSGSSSGADRHQVIVHFDANGRRELADGSTVSAETARRLLCDASLVAVAEADGEPLSVGRRTRTIPSSIRRGLRPVPQAGREPGQRPAQADREEIAAQLVDALPL